jgi:hypothetical protein
MPSITAHTTEIIKVSDGNHGYPFVARCSCGWNSWGYVRAHAAQIMADDHVQKEA